MATIITFGGHGWERRCDARCHRATGRTCTCICSGIYHGRQQILSREWNHLLQRANPPRYPGLYPPGTFTA